MEAPFIQFEIRSYDRYGDAQDIESFDTLKEAKNYFDRCELAGDIVGVECEKHTTRYTPRREKYESLFSKGDITAANA